MIPLMLGTALARALSPLSIQRPAPATAPGQAPPPQVPLSQRSPGPQAPVNPTGALPPRPVAPPPRVVDTKVPPPIVAPTDPVGSEVPPGPLTADEAARIALRLQPNVQAARGSAQTARGNADITASALLPQGTLIAGYSNARVDGGLGAPTGAGAAGSISGFPTSSSVSVSQLLFDFGQTRNRVRQDRALADAALADLDRAALVAVNDVENAFYNVANDRRLVLVAQDNVVNRQRQLDLAQGRLSSGIGLPIDVVTAQTSKSQAVVTLIQARDTEQQDRVLLLQLMGLNPLTPLDASQEDAPAAALADPRALFVSGYQRRPEVHAALRTLAAYRYGVSAAKALDLPALYASVGGGFAADRVAGEYGSSTAFSIGITFPFLDGGRRRGAVTAAQGQLVTAQADLRTAVIQVQADVASAYLGVLSAEQRVAAAASEVRNAEEGVRIAEGRYANGLGLFQDITTAQDLLNRAEQDATTARNALNLARVKLRYATGQFP